MSLGLGSELVTARTVEGRFPSIDKAIPKKRPLFTFCVDPKTLAETLLAIADLLPDESRAVQFFFYGKDTPIGICAQNHDNGMMIDALVIPLGMPDQTEKPGAKEKPAEESKPEETSTNGDQQTFSEKLAVAYQDAKARHPGMLLLFRVGETYRAFADDAKVLGMTFGRIPGDGVFVFPHSELEDHLKRLLADGHRVAVCDQAEDANGKEVTRVVLPDPTDSKETKPARKRGSSR